MTPNMKRAILSFLFVCACAVAGPDDAARGLIGRVVPKHAARFVVETIPAEQGRDVFEIESRGGPFDDAQDDGTGDMSQRSEVGGQTIRNS